MKKGVMRDQEWKRYYKEKYAEYWYGRRRDLFYAEKHKEYHNNLINLVKSLKFKIKDNKILEVGIGTCYPFASTLSKEGFEVTGIDISDYKETWRNYPEIACMNGDAEKLPFKDESFSLTYCFQTTWELPDIYKAIREMVRVTVGGGGYILFDIMNGFSPRQLRTYLITRNSIIYKSAKILINVKRRLLKEPIPELVNFNANPANSLKVSKFLDELGVQHKVATFYNFDFERISWKDYLCFRLVYLCKKE